MNIREDDLSSSPTQDLLRLHLAGMHANSPPGHVFALDLSGLKTPDITVWSVWDGAAICGIGALKQLDGSTGEIKSMRTHPDHLRKGVGQRLLEHIITTARARKLRRLSLETGSGPAFDPALALYRRRGFVGIHRYADQFGSGFRQCLHLIDGRSHIGGVGVRHRLNDDWMVAADGNTADFHRHGTAARVCCHESSQEFLL